MSDNDDNDDALRPGDPVAVDERGKVRRARPTAQAFERATITVGGVALPGFVEVEYSGLPEQPAAGADGATTGRFTATGTVNGDGMRRLIDAIDAVGRDPERDTIDRLLELIEPAVLRAADTGEAQAVRVSMVFAGERPSTDHLALVQRAIDRAVRGTALTGYVAPFGNSLAAVIRVPTKADG